MKFKDLNEKNETIYDLNIDMSPSVLRELMAEYNKNRKLWIEKNGNDKGYDEWFTSQITKNK